MPRSTTSIYQPNDPRYWKRGGFLFDVDDCRWYRIQKVEETPGQARITLEKPPPANIRSAAFMRNIVDVYPLGDVR